MKKIAIFVKNIHVLNRWKENLAKFEYTIIDTFEELFYLEQSLLIIDSCSQIKEIDASIQRFILKNNKIIVLETAPSLQNAKRYISLGVQGYGNSYMSLPYFKASIEAISKDLVWLSPDIATLLVKSFTLIENKDNQVDFSSLTKTETKIAKLLKKGLSNQEIANELDSSINTVKTHIKKVYSKLGVGDRISFINLFN